MTVSFPSLLAPMQRLRRLMIYVQFQSTLSYVNDPVYIVQGLQDIGAKVEGGKYNDEFTFETDIAALLGKAHDEHSMERSGGGEAVELL